MKMNLAATDLSKTPQSVDTPVKITCSDVNLWYGDKHALKGITLDLKQNAVTALIGPSGCGKSTFLRCLNRMNDQIKGVRIEGSILMDDTDILDPKLDVVNLRTHVGMVFQKPNPFPKSIYNNISYAPLMHGLVKKGAECDDLVEDSIKKAGLWDEVADRLDASGTSLSGGQQQRLCIARAIAVQPEVLLMDEPASALDPISTATIEDLIQELSDSYTIAIVTHNLQQAARVAGYTEFFYMGDLIEYDNTGQLFTNPSNKRTEDYITGRYG